MELLVFQVKGEKRQPPQPKVYLVFVDTDFPVMRGREPCSVFAESLFLRTCGGDVGRADGERPPSHPTAQSGVVCFPSLCSRGSSPVCQLTPRGSFGPRTRVLRCGRHQVRIQPTFQGKKVKVQTTVTQFLSNDFDGATSQLHHNRSTSTAVYATRCLWNIRRKEGFYLAVPCAASCHVHFLGTNIKVWCAIGRLVDRQWPYIWTRLLALRCSDSGGSDVG